MRNRLCWGIIALIAVTAAETASAFTFSYDSAGDAYCKEDGGKPITLILSEPKTVQWVLFDYVMVAPTSVVGTTVEVVVPPWPGGANLIPLGVWTGSEMSANWEDFVYLLKPGLREIDEDYDHWYAGQYIPVYGDYFMSPLGSRDIQVDFVYKVDSSRTRVGPAGIIVKNPGELDVEVPAGNLGESPDNYYIELVADEGTFDEQWADDTLDFTYVPPTAQIDSIDPNWSYFSGNISVRIYGTNFHGSYTNTVIFGQIDPLDMIIAYATGVVCENPAGPSAYLDCIVPRNPTGQDGFTDVQVLNDYTLGVERGNLFQYVDAAPWEVYLRSPQNGATVAGTVELLAEGRDDNGISQMEFRYYSSAAATISVTDASRVGDVVTYTTALPHGLAAGDFVSIQGMTPADFDVQVAVVTGAPLGTTFTVDLPGPSANSTAGGDVREYGLLGTATTFPFTHDWDTTAFSDVSYTLIAVAYDNRASGSQIAFTPNPTTVTVANGNLPAVDNPPVVTILTPADGATVATVDGGGNPIPLLLSATATDEYHLDTATTIVAGAGTTDVTVSTSVMTPDEHVGRMLRFYDTGNTYRILSNTADTFTVEGNASGESDTDTVAAVGPVAAAIQFFVRLNGTQDTISVGFGTEGPAGVWTLAWNGELDLGFGAQAYEGEHLIFAEATDPGGLKAMDGVSITVDNSSDPLPLVITRIEPNYADFAGADAARNPVTVTVSGSGFSDGNVTLSFDGAAAKGLTVSAVSAYNAGGDDTDVTISAAGMAVNAYVGRSIRFVASDNTYVIEANTADTFTVTGDASGESAGDGVIIEGAAEIIAVVPHAPAGAVEGPAAVRVTVGASQYIADDMFYWIDSAPTCELTSPQPSPPIVGETVTLVADARDDRAVVSVIFQYAADDGGGNPTGPWIDIVELTSGPYEYDWDTAAAGLGGASTEYIHLRAQATDGHVAGAWNATGAQSTTSTPTVLIGINQDPGVFDNPPDVAITMPGAGATVKGDVLLEAVVTDDKRTAETDIELDFQVVDTGSAQVYATLTFPADVTRVFDAGPPATWTFTATWPTTLGNPVDGSNYRIVATATDTTTSQTGEASADVTLKNTPVGGGGGGGCFKSTTRATGPSDPGVFLAWMLMAGAMLVLVRRARAQVA